MALSIRRRVHRDDPTSPRLWTVLTSALFASRWIGRDAPQFPQLGLGEGAPTLLYFRTRGCTVCDLVDMRVAQACHRAGVQLVIVDRYAKSDSPEDHAVYELPGNVLDRGGPINEAYGVGVYPSFVLVNAAGRVVLKDVGAKAPVDSFDQYLQGQFQSRLPST